MVATPRSSRYPFSGCCYILLEARNLLRICTGPVENVLTPSGNLLASGEMYWELCYLAQFVAI